MLQKDPQITITEIDAPAPTTHNLGDLTPDQLEAFDVFKTNLINAGLYTPGRTTPSKDEPLEASHDDLTLLCVGVQHRHDQLTYQPFELDDFLEPVVLILSRLKNNSLAQRIGEENTRSTTFSLLSHLTNSSPRGDSIHDGQGDGIRYVGILFDMISLR